jgi:hypothetical protein
MYIQVGNEGYCIDLDSEDEKDVEAAKEKVRVDAKEIGCHSPEAFEVALKGRYDPCMTFIYKSCRVLREKSCSPRTSSSWRICALIVSWEMCSFSPTRPKLPSLATAQK